MHGITNEVIIPFTVIHGEQADPWKNFRISFQGNLRLNRTDYGIGEKDEIGDEVTIDLMISARIMNMQTIALFSRPFGKEMMEKIEKGSVQDARAHIAVLQNNEDPDVAKPESFIRLSQKFFQKQMFEKAIQACELGIEVFPDEASLPASLANIYFRMGQTGKAREASETALTLETDHSMALEIMKWLNKD